MVKYVYISILVFLAAFAFYFYEKTVQLESLVAAAKDESAKQWSMLYRNPPWSSSPNLSIWAAVPPSPGEVLTVTAYSSPRPLKKRRVKKVLTASGTKPVRGAVAVSRDLFQRGWGFGKRIYIKNHGVFTITDLMNSRIVRTIDIYMDNRTEAIQFGKKRLEVLLIDA